MKPKKLSVVLLSVFCFSAVVLPNFAQADSLYTVKIFFDANLNGIYDYDSVRNPGETKPEALTNKTVCYEGFVPCGKKMCAGGATALSEGKCKTEDGLCVGGKETEKEIQCQLCHFFIMINNTVNYVILKIVPLLAVLMLVLAGVMYYFGGVRPELLSRAKTLIKGVVIGLVLIYGAYMIVNVFLIVLGASEVNAIKDVFHDGVFSIKCPVYVSNKIIP
ncbi:MAG: hypothetical protein PHE77_02435 [Candidatus Pacebacteria bacterium]|nr:hypothetical protein [Candidatus Paceibacterota bacterium]